MRVSVSVREFFMFLFQINNLKVILFSLKKNTSSKIFALK